MKKPLILASKSPQRKQILEDLGLKFKVEPAHIDEHHSGFKKPHAIVKSIAFRKAEAIAKKNPNSWVLGCDTIVVLKNGSITIKPRDRADAKRILNAYSDSYCDVYSGLALVNISEKKELIGYERTRIHFRKLKKQEIDWYLGTGDWKGRSGALTIEGKDSWTRKMEGDYWNIVGLPVNMLKHFLIKVEN